MNRADEAPRLVPRRPTSAFVGSMDPMRTVGSILAERTVTGYIRRPRVHSATRSHLASVPARAAQPLPATEHWARSSTSSWRLHHIQSESHEDDSRQGCQTLRTSRKKWASRPRRPQSCGSRQDISASRSLPTSDQICAQQQTTTTARRQAPLTLHRSLFAGVLLLKTGDNTLVARLRAQREDLLLDGLRTMAARLGLRVLREVDLLLLLLSIFHTDTVDEGESRYLFKYLDARNQGVVELRDVLTGISTLFRPYDVTAALCCKRLASHQFSAECLVTVDEMARMIQGVIDLLRDHPLTHVAALRAVETRVAAEMQEVHLDYCVPATTAHKLLKQERSLMEALAFIDWNGKILLPINKESELERLLKEGARLQGAPASSRRGGARQLAARSEENRVILGYIHDIYANTFLADAVREESVARPVDASHPRFVADKYINRTRIASSVI